MNGSLTFCYAKCICYRVHWEDICIVLALVMFMSCAWVGEEQLLQLPAIVSLLLKNSG